MKTSQTSVTKSNTNALPASLLPLRPGAPLPKPRTLEAIRLVNDRVDRFCHYFAAPLVYWAEGGKLLVEMVREDKDVFKKIIARSGGLISEHTLNQFVRMGSAELRPEMLLLPAHIGSRLSTLPFSTQNRLLDTGVDIVVDLKPGGEPIVHRKKATDLTGSDVRLFVKPGGRASRTVDEQAREKKSQRNPRRAHIPARKTEIALGNFRIVMRGGEPTLEPWRDGVIAGATKIVLTTSGRNPGAFIQLSKEA